MHVQSWALLFINFLHFKTFYLTNYHNERIFLLGNLAKSELRRRKRWQLLSLELDDDVGQRIEIADESLRPDTLVESVMTNTRIQEVIDALPAVYERVVILRDVEGRSYQEIAEMVGCPVGTVKSRVNRGRLWLRQKLKIDAKDVGLVVESCQWCRG